LDIHPARRNQKEKRQFAAIPNCRRKSVETKLE